MSWESIREKCTPGPWTVREARDHDGELTDCFVTAPDVNGFPYEAELLGDDEYRGDKGMERKRADAYLMAAALEMYDALRYVAAGFPPVEINESGYRRKVLDALAKANPCVVVEEAEPDGNNGNRTDA